MSVQDITWLPYIQILNLVNYSLKPAHSYWIATFIVNNS